MAAASVVVSGGGAGHSTSTGSSPRALALFIRPAISRASASDVPGYSPMSKRRCRPLIRMRRPQPLRPLGCTRRHKPAFALDRDAIPLAVWKGSPAHKRIEGLIGVGLALYANEPRKPKHDRAFSVLRRLRGLGRRLGLRY